jgi:hypothetical protein
MYVRVAHVMYVRVAHVMYVRVAHVRYYHDLHCGCAFHNIAQNNPSATYA